MDDDREFGQRLQQMLSKKGQDLVKGLVEEIAVLHRQIADMRREMAALADFKGSRWLSLETGKNDGPALPRSVIIEADQHLAPRSGFYPVEYTADGVPFRWTGPTPQFFFEIYVDRRCGADLALDALSCIDFEAQKKITLMADGESIPVELVRDGSGFRVLATLPERDDRFATNLAFILPKVMPPAEGSDTRPLGLAFNKLAVSSRAMPKVFDAGSVAESASAGGESQAPSAADEGVIAEPVL
jgi:hypothetical protein